MFPSPQIISVTRSSTLRELMEELGPNVLYAYDRRVIVVLVNGESRWPSLRLVYGDRVTIMPIVTGG